MRDSEREFIKKICSWLTPGPFDMKPNRPSLWTTLMQCQETMVAMAKENC